MPAAPELFVKPGGEANQEDSSRKRSAAAFTADQEIPPCGAKADPADAATETDYGSGFPANDGVSYEEEEEDSSGMCVDYSEPSQFEHFVQSPLLKAPSVPDTDYYFYFDETDDAAAGKGFVGNSSGRDAGAAEQPDTQADPPPVLQRPLVCAASSLPVPRGLKREVSSAVRIIFSFRELQF
jgi:hypothetical protein